MTKRRLVDRVHRIINPITRRMPGQMVLETKGRVSGQPRRNTELPLITRTANRRLGTDLLTVRIDLDQ